MSTTRELDPRIRDWEAAGVISPDMGDAIRAFERERHAAEHRGDRPEERPEARRAPSIAEALGYLGGLLALAGLISLAANYWDEVPTGLRLAAVAIGAVAFGAAGRAVDEASSPALARLRWVLWELSTAATGLFVGLVMVDVRAVDTPESTALVVATAVGAQSALLWQGRRRPLQLLTMLVAAVVATGAAAAHLGGDVVTGLAVWCAGAIVLGIGLRRQPVDSVAYAGVGSIAMLVGAIMSGVDRGGGQLVFFAMTAVLIVAAAALPAVTPTRPLAITMGIVSVIATLQAAPSTIGYFAEQAGIATGAVVWAIGAVTLAAATTRTVRAAAVFELVGGVTVVGGAAIIGVQSVPLAVAAGIATSVSLLMAGALPERALLSIPGAVGLLVNVPWAIAHFFPGEGRVPLLVFVTGLVIVGVAVVIARRAPHFGDARHGHTDGLSDS